MLCHPWAGRGLGIRIPKGKIEDGPSLPPWVKALPSFPSQIKAVVKITFSEEDYHFPWFPNAPF